MLAPKIINDLGMFAAGLYCTYHGYRSKSPVKANHIQFFRVAGPFLIVAAVVLLLFGQPPQSATQKATDDGFASATFPGEPLEDRSPGQISGITVSQITYKYNDPSRDVCLILSRSPILNLGVSDEQRISALLDYGRAAMKQNLIELEMSAFGKLPCYQFKLRNSGEPVMMTIMRLVITNTNLYRVIATFPEKEVGETDPEIHTFLESFCAGPQS